MTRSSHICCTPILHRFTVLLRIVLLGLLAASCSSGGENPAPSKSTNASLESLSIDGVVLDTAFSSSVNDYAATVDSQTASIHVTATVRDPGATVTVNGSVVDSGSTSGPIALHEGDTTINIVVTAEDGITTQSYTVVVTRQIVVTQYDLMHGLDFDGDTGWVATLETSSVGEFTTELDIERFLNSTTYSVSLMNGDEVALSLDNSNSVWDVVVFDLFDRGSASASLSADASEITLDFSTPADSMRIDLQLRTVDSSTALEFLQANGVGDNDGNQVNIYSPTAAGEALVAYDAAFVFPATSTYETVPPISSNAWLESLSVESASLDSGFASSVTDYAVTVSCANDSTRINATASDPNATITIDGIEVASGVDTDPIALDRGSNTITIVVTAEDGSTTQTYTVGVTRCRTDASLSSLTLSSGNIEPPFSPSVTEYQALVPFGTSSVEVSATPNDANSTITIDGGTETNVPLEIGENTIVVTVTADDGVTTRSYSIVISRDLLLTSLSISGGRLVPVFSPTVTDYQVVVPMGTHGVRVFATPNYENSTITINGDTETWVPLETGENTIVVTVTADDGVTTQNYTVVVERPASTDATLSALALNNVDLAPTFYRGLHEYTAVASSGITEVEVTAESSNANANVTINGGTSAYVPIAVGENTISIEVTAEDGTTMTTYTVIVTRLTADNANLSDLRLPLATWDPPFDTEQSDYTLTVGAFSRNLQLTPTAEDTDAQITVNGAVVVSGSSSAPIALAEGANLLNINVTSADGTAARTYTLAVYRQSALPVSQTAYVKASNSDAHDFFGGRVALSADGRTLVVGATGESSNALGVNGDEQNNSESGAGAVYVFAREDDATWGQQAYVKASQRDNLWYDTSVPDYFGTSVALSSDGAMLAASAPMEGGYRFGDDVFPLDGPTGMVDVYRRESAVAWRGARSFGPDGSSNRLGTNIALSGDGRTLATSNSGDRGAVAITADDGSGLMQQAYIERPAPEVQCPYAPCKAVLLALSDDGSTLAVGGYAVHLFVREGSVWSETATIEEAAIAGRPTGLSLSGDGRTLAIASFGSAYVYTDEGGGWIERTYVRMPDSDVADSVSLSGDGGILAVGAASGDSAATGVDGDDTNNTATDSGGVYLFTRNSDDRWVTRTYIKASNTDAEDLFGTSVALSADGTTLVVGAIGEDSTATSVDGDEADNGSVNSGAVYIFELDNSP